MAWFASSSPSIPWHDPELSTPGICLRLGACLVAAVDFSVLSIPTGCATHHQPHEPHAQKPPLFIPFSPTNPALAWAAHKLARISKKLHCEKEASKAHPPRTTSISLGCLASPSYSKYSGRYRHPYIMVGAQRDVPIKSAQVEALVSLAGPTITANNVKADSGACDRL